MKVRKLNLKRTLSILFITILLFEIIFVPAAYFLLRRIISNKARIEIENIQTFNYPEEQKLLTFHLNDLDNNPDLQFIHSKEFRFQGEMYDIISKKKHGDSITYHCYHDVRETRLIAAVENIVRESIGIVYSSEGKSFRQLNIKSQADQFISITEIKNNEFFQQIEYNNFSCKTLQNHIEVPNPPPKYFS